MKSELITRREALKGMASVGSVALTSRALALPSEAPILVSGRPVEIALCAVTPQTIRVTLQPIQDGRPEAPPVDGALIDGKWDSPFLRLRNLSGTRSVTKGDLEVKVSVNPTFGQSALMIRVQTSSDRLVQELRIDATTGNLGFNLGDGPLFGLGEGGPQFDRRGNNYLNLSGQRGYRLYTHGSRVPIQLLIGSSGWGMFVHHPLGAFDLSGRQGQLEPMGGQSALPLDVFVINAKEPATILGEYARITGYAEMPPLWSLGYQQSHRTLGEPEEILQEARMFREKKLPCDTLIYLGTGGSCPRGWNMANTASREFMWNPATFPNPSATLQELHNEHFKVALQIVDEGHHLNGTVADPCTAPPPAPGSSWPLERQVSCYWHEHKPLVDLGLDGWWPDDGDSLDAPSRLARNRMYFEGQQIYRPNTRVYALNRNGYAGIQRFASFMWSGDVESRWETLKTHIPNAINTGLSGIPYWGTDIGGFVPTEEYTGELYARWFQFATFTPLFRSHGVDWRLHLPWGWDTGDIGFPETRTPFHPDPAELHNPAIEPICKKYIELRYRLMPYLYSAVRETCETGMPIIRALWLHYPDDPTAVARGDEYLYGRNILVAPVTEKGAVSKNLYLPHGSWYDFWTNENVEGGKELTRAVDLATIPLYVRAGSVLPTGPIKQYTTEKVTGPLTLTVYPGADGGFLLYDDDGESFDYRKGQYTRIELRWDDRTRQLAFIPQHVSGRWNQLTQDIEVRLATGGVTKHLSFGDKVQHVQF